MKKYFVLTSILALAACGGGSGGGGSHGGPGAPVLPDIPDGMRAAVTDGAAESNEYVTKMKSEVVVADKGGKSYLARTPMAIAGVDGYTFTSYRLDDVKFFAADADTTNDGYLNLGINENGKIDSMYMVVGGNGARPDQAIARDGETSSTFKAPIFEYVMDTKSGEVDFASQTPEQLENERNENHWSQKGYWNHNMSTDKYEYWELGDEAVYRTVGVANYDALTALESSEHLSGGHWNRTDEVMPVVTYGGNIDGNGTSLQYSDFGHFNPVYENKRVYLNGGSGDVATGWTHDASKSGTYKENDKFAEELAAEDYQLFAGGYAIKGDGTMTGDRPSLEPVIGATYKGMAIGRVYTDIHFADGMDDEQRAPYLTAYGITSGDGRDIAKKFTTYDATMKITQSGDQVVQTLNMPFNTHAVGDKYYDIEIKQTDGVVNHVNFTGDESAITSQYRLHGAENHWDMAHASFNPGYYGVDTATEAAGTAAIRASEYDAGPDKSLPTGKAERNYEVQAAWGMIKQ